MFDIKNKYRYKKKKTEQWNLYLYDMYLFSNLLNQKHWKWWCSFFHSLLFLFFSILSPWNKYNTYYYNYNINYTPIKIKLQIFCLAVSPLNPTRRRPNIIIIIFFFSSSSSSKKKKGSKIYILMNLLLVAFVFFFISSFMYYYTFYCIALWLLLCVGWCSDIIMIVEIGVQVANNLSVRTTAVVFKR